MKTPVKIGAIGVVSLLAVLAGCASTSQAAGRDGLTAQVGIYPPPLPNVQRARIGVPPFLVHEGVEQQLDVLAADQLATLAANAQRFDVIERAQLDQLLKEQGLEGIVVQGEMARAAQVRGVDWLLLGKVTSLRVKQDRTGTGFNLGSVPIPGTFGTLGLFGIENRDVVLKVECGVDLRLVDPSTGATVAADFSEFDRTDTASAMGLQILGGNGNADASVATSADDQGRILRLALDDCLRKLLPKVDRALQQRSAGPRDGTARDGSARDADAAQTGEVVSTGQGQAPAFCAQCGGRLVPAAKFCGSCGTRAQ